MVTRGRLLVKSVARKGRLKEVGNEMRMIMGHLTQGGCLVMWCWMKKI